jgi:hypothetical protein
MPYLQLVQNELALTRGRTIDSAGRSNGYPAYRGLWSSSNTSVLSIVYQDGSGIYLTNEKKFRLAYYNDSMWFTSDLSQPAYIPTNTISLQWYDEWANQTNTSIDYKGLVLQSMSAGHALNVLAAYPAPISFCRKSKNNQGRNVPWSDQDAWIAPVNRYGGSNGEPVAFSWWPDSAGHYGSFWLSSRNGPWALRPTVLGLPNIDSATIEQRPSDYVGEWIAYTGYRWEFANSDAKAMRIEFQHLGGSTYEMSSDGKRLNQAGHWYQVLPHVDIYNGTEFYNENNNGVFEMDFVVIANANRNFIPDDTLVYRVGPYAEFRRLQNEPWFPLNINAITSNLPKGGNLCSVSFWDGSQLDCLTQNVPYTYDLGLSECSTLDSFTNDIHCQDWAKYNKGEALQRQLTSLCANSTYNDPSLCNCFLNESIYYNRLVENVGTTAARGIQATRGLQCESGLCPQDGSLSSNLFYYGDRSCNYCIQVFELNLTAETINANINSIQQCVTTDASYTFQDLIARLKELGAYQQSNGTGIYKDVVIGLDNTIYLNTTTVKGKNALQNLPLLQYIPSLDQYKRIMITEQTYRGNITGYSRDITLFLLYIRAP